MSQIGRICGELAEIVSKHNLFTCLFPVYPLVNILFDHVSFPVSATNHVSICPRVIFLLLHVSLSVFSRQAHLGIPQAGRVVGGVLPRSGTDVTRNTKL